MSLAFGGYLVSDFLSPTNVKSTVSRISKTLSISNLVQTKQIKHQAEREEAIDVARKLVCSVFSFS